jgi:hypothetical protein
MKKFFITLAVIVITMTITSCNNTTSSNGSSQATEAKPDENIVKYSKYYPTGLEIAEGLSLSIKTGMIAIDPNLVYTLETKKGVFAFEGNEWPIVDVQISIESKLLNNPVITYKILLEEDKSGTIVGTIKVVRADGKEDPSLKYLENTMYIGNKEGTQQVVLDEAGNIQIVE